MHIESENSGSGLVGKLPNVTKIYTRKWWQFFPWPTGLLVTHKPGASVAHVLKLLLHIQILEKKQMKH